MPQDSPNRLPVSLQGGGPGPGQRSADLRPSNPSSDARVANVTWLPAAGAAIPPRSTRYTADTPAVCTIWPIAWSETAQMPRTCFRRFFSQHSESSGRSKVQSALGTWLYKLGINQCLDHLRSRSVRMGKVSRELDEDDPSWLNAPSAGLAGSSHRPGRSRAGHRAPAGRLPRRISAARRRGVRIITR